MCRCVPKLLSKEALLILIQGAFLVSRTFLTDRISRIEARAGRHLISQVSLFVITRRCSFDTAKKTLLIGATMLLLALRHPRQ